MAQKRMNSKEMDGDMEDEAGEKEMAIEKTLGAMDSEMVDHLDNAQMRKLLKQAVNYFRSDKD
jgi:hypothetical protein